jgi:cobalt-precorrin-6B (C15)-methyltransferase
MIPDEEFYKNPNIPGPTKEEIRCLVMCKAKPSPHEIAIEIGCGTGGLTVELSRRVDSVYAIDKNPKAIQVTRKNLEKLNPNAPVNLVEGDALQVLSGLPSNDILIVGGSSGDLRPILEEGFKKLNNHGRIVVTSILLETRVIALETLKMLGLKPRVIEVFIARGSETSTGTMMRGLNPLSIVWAVKSY